MPKIYRLLLALGFALAPLPDCLELSPRDERLNTAVNVG